MQNAKCKMQNLFLVLLLFVYTSAEAQGLFKIDSIPNPPQSTRLEDRKERTNINQMDVVANITHYQSPLSPDVIISFYAQHLPGKGWELLGKEAKGQLGIAIFAKGQESVSINAYSLTAGTTDIYISRSTTPKEASSQVQVDKTQDVPGKDLPYAPRYPNAVRTMYKQDKNTGTTTVSYAVDADPGEIIGFYQRKMADNGWQLSNNIDLAQLPGIGSGTFKTLFFKSAEGRCQVSINRADDFYGIKETAVLLNYMPGLVGRGR